MTKQDIFTQAFSTGTSGCRDECHCGRQFYNLDQGWDWEEGEVEQLKESGATELGYSVGAVEFEGDHYVEVCSCWHQRAERLMDLLFGNARQICDFFTAIKAEQYRRAELMPVVDFDPTAGLWNEMKTAPKTCEWVEVLTVEGEKQKTFKAHWASDLSGEEQPPFEGWFYQVKGARGYLAVPGKISGWRHLPKDSG